MNTIIAVIGGSQCSVGEAKAAKVVGRELARRGFALVCGGLTGVMKAAARGVAGAGSRTVGILPGNNPEEANPYIQVPIVTGMGYARNSIVVKSARAVIAVGGSFGTLSEIAFALQGGIPVVGVGTWEMHREGESRDPIIRATTPEEAVDKALAATGDAPKEAVEHRH